MPCSLCEAYFIVNPCTDYNRISSFIKEHIKRLEWFNHLQPRCPCRECIVGMMCTRQQSLKCEVFNNAVTFEVNKRFQLWF